jgi:hypothetical protein
MGARKGKNVIGVFRDVLTSPTATFTEADQYPPMFFIKYAVVLAVLRAVLSVVLVVGADVLLLLSLWRVLLLETLRRALSVVVLVLLWGALIHLVSLVLGFRLAKRFANRKSVLTSLEIAAYGSTPFIFFGAFPIPVLYPLWLGWSVALLSLGVHIRHRVSLAHGAAIAIVSTFLLALMAGFAMLTI